jgi:two-component system OmpR family response regulator
VDSNHDTCFILSTLLRWEGYEVSSAGGVAESKRAVLSGQFDLIILDGGFADGSGTDLCRWMREQAPQTPVVFYSGAYTEGDGDGGTCAGAAAYVSKPDVDGLLAAVNGLLRSKELAGSGEVRQVAAAESPSATSGRT